MKKTVLIKKNNSMLFPDHLDQEEITICRMFRGDGKIASSIRLFLLRLRLPVPAFFYNRELKQLEPDLFIIQDADARIGFLKWMRKHHPRTRIVLWYWNAVYEVRSVLDPDRIPPDIEKWSYSRYDCNKYGMRYNTTFYPYGTAKRCDAAPLQNDVVFVGKDKGRMEKLIRLKKTLESYGLQTDFHICATRDRDRKKAGYAPTIPYAQVVEKIRMSRAIVDLKVNDQTGPTIRPLETLYWKKKLITDDLEIIGEEFYDPQNVFIIGRDRMESVRDFVYGAFHERNNEEQFTIASWVERFYHPVGNLGHQNLEH